jgi:Nop53 (60S ribosomal biogenesis)
MSSYPPPLLIVHYVHIMNYHVSLLDVMTTAVTAMCIPPPPRLLPFHTDTLIYFAFRYALFSPHRLVDNEDGAIKHVKNNDLFSIDTSGVIDSRKNRRLRRTRDAATKNTDDQVQKTTTTTTRKRKQSSKKKSKSQQTAATKLAKTAEQLLAAANDSRNKRRKKVVERRLAYGRMVLPDGERGGASAMYDLWDDKNEIKMRATVNRDEAHVLDPADLARDDGIDVAYVEHMISRPKIFDREETLDRDSARTDLMDTEQAVALSYNPTKEEVSAAVRAAKHYKAKMKKQQKEVTLKFKGQHPSQQAKKNKNIDWDAELPHDMLAKPRLPVKAEDRKTTRQRNKELRHKAKLRIVEERKKQKDMRRQLGQLSKIVKEVHQAEAEHARSLEAAAQREPIKVPKLGRRVFEEAPVKMPPVNRLKRGSLRQVPSSGTVLSDQFKRFEKMRFIEPRVRTAKKKLKQRKMKYYDKDADFDITALQDW